MFFQHVLKGRWALLVIGPGQIMMVRSVSVIGLITTNTHGAHTCTSLCSFWLVWYPNAVFKLCTASTMPSFSFQYKYLHTLCYLCLRISTEVEMSGQASDTAWWDLKADFWHFSSRTIIGIISENRHKQAGSIKGYTEQLVVIKGERQGRWERKREVRNLH